MKFIFMYQTTFWTENVWYRKCQKWSQPDMKMVDAWSDSISTKWLLANPKKRCIARPQDALLINVNGLPIKGNYVNVVGHSERFDIRVNEVIIKSENVGLVRQPLSKTKYKLEGRLQTDYRVRKG